MRVDWEASVREFITTLLSSIRINITHLQQSALDFDRPSRNSLSCLKIDRVSTFRRSLSRLPHLVRDGVTQEYPQGSRRLPSLSVPVIGASESHSHRGYTRQRVLHFNSLSRDSPIQLALHFQQVLVHARVRCEVWMLRDSIWQGAVCELALPTRVN